MTNERAAEMLYESAVHQASNADEYRETDYGMSAIYLKDAANLCELARLVLKSVSSAAYEFASQLDTAARDEIPAEVWEHIGGRALNAVTVARTACSTCTASGF